MTTVEFENIADLQAIAAIEVQKEVGTRRRRAIARAFVVAGEVASRLAALLLLAAVGPALVIVAAAIVVTSAGAPFYSQARIGRDGRPFTMWKLRTMYRGAEERRRWLDDLNEADGPLFKLRHDPRVTPLGRVLRRFSIDELPQLWNVVRGDMAFIGPRPSLPAEADALDADERLRLTVKPGLTGLWQVSGRSDLDWETSIALDLHYVRFRSLRLNAAILWRTAAAVVLARGAY